MRLNVAVQLLSAVMVTTPSEQSASPLQPVKVEPVSAVAVRVITVPDVYISVQSVPQLMPAGAEVTVPLPVPALVTVRTTIPVPARGMSNVEGSGSFEMVLMLVDFSPSDVGENAATIVQLEPDVSVGVRLGQGFIPPIITLNIPESPPAMLIELMTRSAVPVFEIVKVCEAEAPTFTLPKSWDIGETKIFG